MNEENIDPGIQEQINFMFASVTYPTAQQQIQVIFAQTSELKNFANYLFNTIANESLGYSARSAACIQLRHKIRNIPIENRHQIKQLSSTILPKILHSEDPVFTNSVAALIAEVSSEFGSSIFQSFSTTIESLLSDESSLYNGLSLIYELSSNGEVIQGEYLNHLLDYLTYEDPRINLITSNIIKELSSKIPAIIKEQVIIPLISNGEFGSLQEDCIVQIIDSSSNLLQAFSDDYEISEEERYLIYEFFKFCVQSNHDGYAIPAAYALQENSFDLDQDLIEYLFLKISQDEDLCEGTFSQQCASLISETIHRDPETYQEIFGQLIKENIQSPQIHLVKSALRTLSITSELFEDISDIVSYVISQAATNSPTKADAIGCIANIGAINSNFSESALNTIFPSINDPNENIRMEALRSLTVILSALEHPADPYLQNFVLAIQRYKQYEGVNIFNSLAAFFRTCTDLESSPNTEPIVTNIISIFMETNESDPLYDAVLSSIRELICCVPDFLVPVFSADGFLIKLKSAIDGDSDLKQVDENTEANNSSLTAPILSFFSACLNNNSEGFSNFPDFLEYLADTCANLITNGTSGSKTCAWEFLSSVLNTEVLNFEKYYEIILEKSQIINCENECDDVVGNCAYLLYSLLQKIGSNIEQSVLKNILRNMAKSLTMVNDSDDSKNIAVTIMLIMYILQVQTINDVSDVPSDANNYLQTVILELEETEGIPESCLELCQMFKVQQSE